MNISKLFFVALLSPLFVIPVFTKAQQTITSKLTTGFQQFTDQSNLKNGIASLYVVDAKNGNVVFEKNSQIGLPTASTLKVITSITVLDILGPEYRYQTTLYYTGEIDSLGVLQGDIVIQGSGDPTLGSDRFPEQREEQLLTKWSQTIKNAGILQINGRVIGDDRLYLGNDIPGGWIWTDIGNYYGAGISALNWRENKMGVNFSVSAIGQPTPISNMTHDISYLSIVNQVTTGAKGSGDNVYAYSAPYSEKIYLRGSYGQDLKKTIEISVPDPAYDAAHQLHQRISAEGIIVSGNPTTGQRLVEQDSVFPSKTKDLDIHSSPRLIDMVYWFNQKSINLYGEALLKSIGYFTGNKTTTSGGAMYLKKYWNQKLQIQEQELDVKDGSGLSPQNHVTAAAMTQIMYYAISRPWYTDFVKALPTYNQMTMKSGTIGGTLGYTGYHTAKDGKAYAFTLLVYNYNGTASKMRQNMFMVLDNLK
ncbi:D-alanyl-D-alanine carboxypeptidase/D-alanyl-D-alanine endopeptidase [Sphingobacterium pedocola]|uniref:D-alanyl-D-alanine carboxypeptidase/D-alanyl-D-alanine-endopeptidase n=1 Tax=Sphingobacterium pedocola TaxID=2082722 RepID=A0ABR9T4E4_9SPHI|nr:D-alanyl-D-alanine carboxypeptidase/D-alanyl-D-alanine-endopeptidase [Sphingobacterium pedocola]MBE8719929.1 D-alanyl-D-alanine carboxypeptidase/D-alanyl-D-alanine-endopeptidase [Sphingobacterium pedocola]